MPRRRGLGAFVAPFDPRLAERLDTLACPCRACRNLDRLRLKVAAHVGRAVRHRLGRFEELTGVDVILVHCLLKNRVPADTYLLFTEPAFGLLQPPHTDHYEATTLEDRDLGRVPLRVRPLEAPSLPVQRPG